MHEAEAALYWFSHIFLAFVVSAGTVTAAVVVTHPASMCGVSQFLVEWF
jgi:hypothetical protein